MKSEEIKATQPSDMSERSWLREIALQLALLNEQRVVTMPLPPSNQVRQQKAPR